jgi:hypothetical protein
LSSSRSPRIGALPHTLPLPTGSSAESPPCQLFFLLSKISPVTFSRIAGAPSLDQRGQCPVLRTGSLARSLGLVWAEVPGMNGSGREASVPFSVLCILPARVPGLVVRSWSSPDTGELEFQQRCSQAEGTQLEVHRILDSAA